MKDISASKTPVAYPEIAGVVRRCSLDPEVCTKHHCHCLDIFMYPGRKLHLCEKVIPKIFLVMGQIGKQNKKKRVKAKDLFQGIEHWENIIIFLNIQIFAICSYLFLQLHRHL